MTICDLRAALYGDKSGSAACFFQWNKNKKGVIIRQYSKKQKIFISSALCISAGIRRMWMR